VVEVDRVFAVAAPRCPAISPPFELARTLLVMGSLQRRVKRRREARESLGRAPVIFQELGASLWMDKTRAELGRIGGRATSPLDLTPTEERVAELVTEGQTNREVAASLFLSVQTVGANPTRIYWTLGVSSHRQLASRVEPITRAFGQKQGLPLIRRPPLWSTL
jgi:DNA-binding CsgD family transcriptional regulator